MKISVATLFARLYEPFLETSLIKRAHQAGAFSCKIYDMFGAVAPLERVDGPTYGHGPGMVIRPEVVERMVDAIQAESGPAYKIFFSPRGERVTQRVIRDIVRDVTQRPGQHIMLLPARYEGMDARIEELYADRVLSMGDFVLMGGDLPAMMFMEAFLRYVPGVVGKQESVEYDSFSGPFVDHSEYTMPAVWKGLEVPEVIRSGNHKAILDWRRAESVRASVQGHFDWVRAYPQLTDADRTAIHTHIPRHYVALMHDQVLIPGMEPGQLKPGTTSVTSIDIHDIARSCATYGIKGYGIVTPLLDQQEIVKTILKFWHTGVGVTYNPHRHHAVKAVHIMDSLDAWLNHIQEQEGVKPLIVTTCARAYADHTRRIDYHDQKKVWSLNRPVLIVLGTGRGLVPELIDQADFHLAPLEGFTLFNHLSVRSAAAVILDKWLGRDIRL